MLKTSLVSKNFQLFTKKNLIFDKKKLIYLIKTTVQNICASKSLIMCIYLRAERPSLEQVGNYCRQKLLNPLWILGLPLIMLGEHHTLNEVFLWQWTKPFGATSRV